MRYKSYLVIITIVICCVFFSCNGKQVSNNNLSSVDNEELIQYFGTSDIKPYKDGNCVNIIVTNSPTIDTVRMLNPEMFSLEQFASIAVLIYENSKPNLKGVDSLFVTINDENNTDTFKYDYKSIKKIREKIAVNTKFGNAIKNNNTQKAISCFSKDILDNTEPYEIENMLKQYFYKYKVENSNLIAFKTDGIDVALYCNYTYSNGVKQTFVFVHFMNEDNKIYGISFPK